MDNDFRIEFDKNLLINPEQDDNNEIKPVNPDDFFARLDNLDKQIMGMDTSVTNIVEQKREIEKELSNLEMLKDNLENDKYEFQNQMKREYETLNNMKIDFEQEKNKMFNDIQDEREKFAKEKREFEKYKKQELDNIEQTKKQLDKNYKQFESIVNKFNSKIDSYNY